MGERRRIKREGLKGAEETREGSVELTAWSVGKDFSFFFLIFFFIIIFSNDGKYKRKLRGTKAVSKPTNSNQQTNRRQSTTSSNF